MDLRCAALTGSAAGMVVGHTVENGNQTIHFTVHFAFGGTVTANIAAGAVTGHTCNTNADFTGTYTVSGCPPGHYVITPGTETITPGTTDIGSHCDDGDTSISLPFQVHLYDQTFSTVQVNSNGRLDFICNNEPGGSIPDCLPAPPHNCPYDYTIFPFWTDLLTDTGLSGCSTWANGCGIFTSVSGTAPNRTFNIEWHAVLFQNNDSTSDFEVRFYENDATRFNIIYGNMNAAGNYVMMVGGVQGSTTSGFFTQDFCLPSNGTPPQNVSRTYAMQPCGTPTPTPTASPSPTPTATATFTATPMPTSTVMATATATAIISPSPMPTASVTPTSTPRVTPTPRFNPSPRPRPSPPPRPAR